MRINQRVDRIPLSQTLALDARAKKLAASGRDIVNMTAGEPDFDSPKVVRDAAKAAINGGRVRYTPAPGRLALREAIAEHLTRTRGVPFTSEEITVCHSGKHALSGALLTLVSDGDEVLLLLPAWVSYVEQVRFAGGASIGVAPRPDMGPDFDALEQAVTSKTAGIMLNSPSNPSGYVCTEEELAKLAAFAKKHDIWILSDEIYGRLVYDSEPYRSTVQYGDDARARTVIVDGASKTYAMTGYRIGFVAAQKKVANAVERLHSQLTGAPNAIGQEAFEAALRSEPPELDIMLAAFCERRDRILEGLEALGMHTPPPRGAFYVFPDITKHWPDGNSEEFCDTLLEREGVAIVPGAAFGVEGHIRFSYATSMENINESLKRLARFLEGLN
ncbi:MAG: aspartate aminotransferase [Planctomycetota bacterium]|jgi:aspartate aminotransferase